KSFRPWRRRRFDVLRPGPSPNGLAAALGLGEAPALHARGALGVLLRLERLDRRLALARLAGSHDGFLLGDEVLLTAACARRRPPRPRRLCRPSSASTSSPRSWPWNPLSCWSPCSTSPVAIWMDASPPLLTNTNCVPSAVVRQDV